MRAGYLTVPVFDTVFGKIERSKMAMKATKDKFTLESFFFIFWLLSCVDLACLLKLVPLQIYGGLREAEKRRSEKANFGVAKVYPINVFITGTFLHTSTIPKQMNNDNTVSRGISMGAAISVKLILTPKSP